MAWTVYEWDMSNELQNRLAAGWSALGMVFFLRAERLETLWRGASGALVELWVGVTKLDSNISESLFIVTDRIYTRNSSNQSWFTMCHMTNSSNVNSSLSGDNFGGQGSEGLNIKYSQVLLGEMWLGIHQGFLIGYYIFWFRHFLVLFSFKYI